MRRFLPLHLGLVAGCVAGLVAHGVFVRAPLPATAQQWKVARAMMPYLQARTQMSERSPVYQYDELLAEVKRQAPHPLTPRLRLVDADRTRLRIPRADYNSMWLERVDFRGADLREADFGHCLLIGCDLRDANMEHADLTDATFDEATMWPVGFDPVDHGARMMREP